MAFATPPAPRQVNSDIMPENIPPGPATMPRLAPRRSLRMVRPHRPTPLPLALASCPSPRSLHINQNSGPGETSIRRRPVVLPSITPVGSDREYDGGDSSYSTSPLASDNNNFRNMGNVSETSAGVGSGRGQFSLRVPRTPRYARSGRAREEPPSPTPRLRTVSARREPCSMDLQQYLEERLREGETTL